MLGIILLHTLACFQKDWIKSDNFRACSAPLHEVADSTLQLRVVSTEDEQNFPLYLHTSSFLFSLILWCLDFDQELRPNNINGDQKWCIIPFYFYSKLHYVIIYYNILWVNIKLNARKLYPMALLIIQNVYVTERELLMSNILFKNLSCQAKLF